MSSSLPNGHVIVISNETRLRALIMLDEITQSYSFARDLEACVHAISTSESLYIDKLQEIGTNYKNNPGLISQGLKVIFMNSRDMARGTIVEDIDTESRKQRARFDQIVQEKYDMVNKDSYKTTLRCRRCGSGDVGVEQKQTRDLSIHMPSPAPLLSPPLPFRLLFCCPSSPPLSSCLILVLSFSCCQMTGGADESMTVFCTCSKCNNRWTMR